MNKLVHLYAVCYNESIVLPFFFKHYKKMFGDSIKFTIFDNESNDGSQDMCIEQGAEVITYSTNDQLSDSKYLEIKNNCWKNQEEPWALIVDIDEELFITREELLKEEELGSTIIRSEGWNLINTENTDKIVFEDIKYGSRCVQYDKNYLFDKRHISQINYTPGCHSSSPVGNVKYSENSYKLFHYKALSEQYLVDRYKMFTSRLSEDNIKNKYGWHYTLLEEEIRRNHRHFQKIENLTRVIE